MKKRCMVRFWSHPAVYSPLQDVEGQINAHYETGVIFGRTALVVLANERLV